MNFERLQSAFGVNRRVYQLVDRDLGFSEINLVVRLPQNRPNCAYLSEIGARGTCDKLGCTRSTGWGHPAKQLHAGVLQGSSGNTRDHNVHVLRTANIHSQRDKGTIYYQLVRV